MYTHSDFIVMRENRDAFEKMKALLDAGIGNLVIYGPEGSGKTHMISVGAEIAEKDGKIIPTAAIMLRMDLELEDDFFDMLGTIPALFIDEVEAAVEHPGTAKLLELMIAERNRLGLLTVFASRQTPEELGLTDLAAAMSDFQVAHIEPMGDDILERSVTALREQLPAKEGRTISDEACKYLAATSESLTELKNKVNFLLMFADVDPNTVIDEAIVRELINR